VSPGGAGGGAGSPRVLAILLGLIGDTLMRLPAVRAVRERHPEARITAVCDPLTAPALRDNPLFDEVLPLDRRGASLASQLAFYRRLRRERFDIALDFYYGARTPLLAYLSGAPRRIGPARGRWARLLFTDPVPFPLPPVHMVDRHLEIVRPLGVTRLTRRWEFPVTEQARRALAERLAGAGVAAPGEADLVICAGAGDVSKRWDDDFLRELIARVADGELGAGRRALVVADQREPDLAAALLGGVAGRVVALPPLTLPELGALFAAAGLAFVPDTGPVHVAVATAPRLITIYQSTDPQLHRAERPGYCWLYRVVCPWQPCDTRDKDKCHLECRRSLAVTDVLAAAARLLAPGAPVGP